MCRAAETQPNTEQSATQQTTLLDSSYDENQLDTSKPIGGIDDKVPVEDAFNHSFVTEGGNDDAAALDVVVCDPCLTNLDHFHRDNDFEALCRSNFICGKELANGINGDIFRYQLRNAQGTEHVAVKKLRNGAITELYGKETNERAIHLGKSWRSTEDALTEIGILSYLSKQQDLPRYVLKMHGVYSDSENNLTWLVTEFADGGELFNVACSGGASQVQLQTYTGHLLQAVEYMHRHNIGHRDISLENVLLKHGICKLMDFGMAVASRSTSGTPFRYFRTVGKAFYRAPECNVPNRASVCVTPPSDAAPGDIAMVAADGFVCEVRLPEHAKPAVRCMADIWGYEAEPADMFALGVCMFMLAFECPPWEEAILSNQYFAYVHRGGEKGLESLLKAWRKPSLCPEAMLLLTSLMKIKPPKRLSAADCLQIPWLANTLDQETANNLN